MNRIWTRRRWLNTVLASSAGVSLARLGFAQSQGEATAEEAKLPERRIELFNTHTNETAKVVFKRGNQYQGDALGALNNVLRDHRNGESHDMDAGLFDQLHDLALAAGCEPSYEIISGYRSPESNDKMSSKPGSGVAKKSLHMQGRAMDVRLKHCTCETLRDLAIAAAKGGVGYYQRSNFVHIDTGAFRTWVG
ncbi:MAG: DUF882 domain-containing protein [Pseudomonadota bacterium]